MCRLNLILILCLECGIFVSLRRGMPRYVYCSCCLRVRKDLFLKWICCACMYALKVMSSKFDLFGHLVIVHLERLWSKCVHSDNM
jgi:hypothetical protein